MLVAVLSLKGSPGVTTFAVALAVRWPGPARSVVIEADPSGGDLATRFSLPSHRGLLSLAAAAHHKADPALVWQHCLALPGGLPVVAAPPDAEQARAALSALVLPQGTDAGVLRAAADVPGVVVIADCGRVDPGSAVMPVVCSADVVVLLTRARADDLAHLARRMPVVGRWSRRAVLLLVGEGYSSAEVARGLGVVPLGRVPVDPRGAAVLSGRSIGPRGSRGGPSRSALGRVAHEVAVRLQPQQPVPAGRGVPDLRAVPAAPMWVNGVWVAPTPPPLPALPVSGFTRGVAS